MESDKLKTVALEIWAKALGFFSFIPKPELRGAAVGASFFALMLFAPVLWLIGMFGVGMYGFWLASKQ